GIGLVEGQQLFLVGREAEEIGRLFNPSHFGSGRAKALAVLFGQLFFVEIGFVSNRVPALVGRLENIAVIAGFHLLPDGLARFVVTLFGGANEIIIRHFKKR